MDASHGVVIYNGTITYTGLNLGYAYNHLNFNGIGGTWNAMDHTTVNGTLTVSNGAYNANGQTTTVAGLTTISGGVYHASTAMQTFNGGLIVNGGVWNGSTGGVTTAFVTLLSGALTAPSGTLSVSGNWSQSGGIFTSNSGTVTFDGAGTQTFDSNNSIFCNVINAGSGTLQLTSHNLTATGALTNSSGVFNANGLIVSVEGLTTISGGTYQASSASQTFNGGLTISGGTFTGLTGEVTVADVTLSSGMLVAPSTNMMVSGNWLNAGGTFTANAGTVILNGNSQTIFGINAFYNLTKSGASAATLTFPSGKTTTVTGTLTLNGSSGKLLTLAPSVAGAQWTINVTGSRSASYLSVSYATNPGETIACTTGCTDGGNNYGWKFVTPALFTWVGAGSDNNWSTGANWQGGAAPGISDAAVFSNVSIKDVTIDTHVDVGGVSILSGYMGTMTQSASKTVTVRAGGWVQAGGTFISGSGGLTDGGNFSLSGGTFNVGNNSIIFNGTGVQTFNAGSAAFYNITHSGSGTLRLTGSALTVTHNFTNSNGLFDLNGQNWTMTGVTFSNSGTLQAQGGETVTGLVMDATHGT
ncbi:MAG: hypothetical protein WCO84_08845, partial [bacterium]